MASVDMAKGAVFRLLGEIAVLVSVMLAILSPTWSRLSAIEDSLKDGESKRERFVQMETKVNLLQGTEGLPQQFASAQKEREWIRDELKRIEEKLDENLGQLDIRLQLEMRMLHESRDLKLVELDTKIQMEIAHAREAVELMIQAVKENVDRL